MVMRSLRIVGLIGLGAAFALGFAILLGWPPLAARSPEIIFTVVDRPGESNSGRFAVLKYAEAHRYQLLGSREDALKPGTLHSHQFFRFDSHIFVNRGFNAGETEVDFRKSVVPMSRSTGEVLRLAEDFKRDMTNEGFVVWERSPG